MCFWHRYAVTLFTGILLLSGCQTKPHPSEPSAIAGRKTLESLAVGAYSYDLALGSCENDRCPFEVVLRSSRGLLDRFTLPIAAYSDEASAEPVDAVWGAEPGMHAWSTGSEQRYVGVAMRAVKLGPSVDGVLVTQRYGFEQLRRLHLVLAREGDKLHRVWSAEEGQGPRWSATALMPEVDGSQPIAYWIGALSTANSEPDRISVQKLTWDTAAKDLVASGLPNASTPLFVTVAGAYGSPAQAHAARDAKGDCLANFFVLATTEYPVSAKGKAVVAVVDVSRSRAEALAAATVQCGVSSRVSIIDARSAEGRKE